MNRFKSFVILDLLLTLPLLIYATCDIVARNANPVEFILPAVLVVIMLPSIVSLAGGVLPQVWAVVCLLLYVGISLFLVFRTIADGHDTYAGILVRVGMILLMAKSVYGIFCVAKSPATPDC
jgi:predicted permease